MGELVSGEDSGLGGWVVRVCACVVGKCGACRASLWGKRGLDRRDVREWGVSDREDSGLGGWVVRICACVTGRSADWAACDHLCGMMRPLAGMAQKSP